METVTDFLFLGSKITADGDCSHEIKRHVRLRRKAKTKLDSILKSRDSTLLTKVCIVRQTIKAMVLPVVIYGCKSWTIKKAKRGRIVAFELWCWRRPLRVFWTARRFNQSILKEISLEYSLEGLMLKFPPDEKNWLTGKDPDAGKDWRQEEQGTTEDKMVGWYHQFDGHEFEQALGVWVGQGSQAFCSPWSCKELDMTERLNWTCSSIPCKEWECRAFMCSSMYSHVTCVGWREGFSQCSSQDSGLVHKWAHSFRNQYYLLSIPYEPSTVPGTGHVEAIKSTKHRAFTQWEFTSPWVIGRLGTCSMHISM